MKKFMITVLLFSFSAHAEKTIDEKKFSTLGKIDESNFKQPEKKEVEVKTPVNTTFSMSCKNSNGVVVKQGEVGYETCLSELKAKQGKPGEKGSANFNFKVGE